MSKNRKTLLIAFIALSVIFVCVGSYGKLKHVDNLLCCGFVLSGFILATAALVVAMQRPKMK